VGFSDKATTYTRIFGGFQNIEGRCRKVFEDWLGTLDSYVHKQCTADAIQVESQDMMLAAAVVIRTSLARRRCCR
jgi:hypothetical protein